MPSPKPRYTDKELQSAIDEYFETNPDKPTVTGLAYFLGFESRQSLYDYKSKDNEIVISALKRIRKKVPFRKLGIKYKNPAQYQLHKYHKDPITNLTVRFNAHLRYALKNNTPTTSDLPYTLDELKSNLESKFTDDMSWDNMNEWHIDHIRPVSSFNFKSKKCNDFKECYSLTNLQPLWAKDNLIKGSYYVGS